MLPAVHKELPRRRRGPRILTREEARAHFDQQARYWFGMSGDEWVEAYRAGKFDSDEDHLRMVSMEMLLPFYSRSDESDCEDSIFGGPRCD